MCGIAGWLFPAPIHPSSESELAWNLQFRVLKHRGPDDAGNWVEASTDGPFSVFLHNRLAIQDLSAAGHQPMVSACGRYVLVFNGEIYNQRQLRSELEAQGHHFRSGSDTEVLLELLARQGEAALARLRGMYAFCLWDRRLRSALLARDPYGIKPLYLWHGPAGELLFASEVRALLASGLIERRLDPQGLAGFLATGSLPEPLTLVAGVRSLPPGHCGTWQAGRWTQRRHWQPSEAHPAAPVPPVAAARITRQALERSVQAHLISDVPVGLFLSGGLDSSALLALAPEPLTTLSIGFPQQDFDESQRAAQLARHFGARHVPLQLDAAAAAEFLPGFLAAIDQPSVDGFNTYCVSALARREGLKVVLSGLGGDELFGGYPSFRAIPRLLRLHRGLGPGRASIARVLARRRTHRARRLAAFLAGPATPEAAHRCQRGLFAPDEVRLLLRYWQIDAAGCPEAGSADHADALPAAACPTLADRIAWLESSRYMGPQLLRDSDTYSMAHGLELRLPLVDAQLLGDLAAIPAHQRLAPGKRLLQRAVPELLKAVPLERKRGFAFPFQSWFGQAGSPLRPGQGPLALPGCPADIDLRPWARRWALIVLRHWLHQHLGLSLPVA
ncbi:asparagine synthase (glutamine-hydrolyzing) [Cyanobium sp. CH-040]|uniref:asparagine synthase (glutamine-hydrolyzing) n=1 Tax=Cyanobium sp. CH-040 TaxID=2823708 RepID=UPI0020CEF6E0|nr:asparagine synthase (glutamine-hydrolyzing) [Cyanobium sp. CH-040]MCP9927895.1 asparagine synthase (glutamine-hydrolyzing) [Cyanobium sp. CH-040]